MSSCVLSRSAWMDPRYSPFFLLEQRFSFTCPAQEKKSAPAAMASAGSVPIMSSTSRTAVACVSGGDQAADRSILHDATRTIQSAET